MNTILSLIVCIAMILSPAGVLSEYPETGTTWTLSNLSVDFGEESVTLPQELEITTGIGTEEALLHFQINEGETVYMPMTGAITAEGVRFNLGNSDRTYTLSQEALLEMVEMSEEDAQILKVMEDVILSYAKLLTAVQNPDFAVQYAEEGWKLMETMLGAERAETTVEVEGEMLSAIKLGGELTVAGVMDMIDASLECGIPELKEFSTVMLDIVNLEMEEPVSSFSELAGLTEEELNEALGMRVDIIAAAGDPAYTRMEMTGDMDGMTMTMISDAIVRGEEGTAVLVMDMTDDENSIGYILDMAYTGPANDPRTMNMTANMFADTHTVYDLGEEESIAYNESLMVEMIAEMNSEDGLKNGSAQVSFAEANSYSSGDDVEYDDNEFALNLNYADRREEDGSITRSYALDLEDDDSPIVVSFDLNRAEAALADYFAGATELPLTMDTEDEAYNMLAADGMIIAANGMQLAADENVTALAEMFMPEEEVYTSEEAYMSDEEMYPAPGEELEEDTSETQADEAETEAVAEGDVTSIEEAEAIFSGTIPAFTAPEGFELEYIYAYDTMVFLTYYSEDSWFEYTVSSLRSDENISYHALKDGSLEAIDGQIVELTTDENGDIAYAALTVDGMDVEFSLGGCDMEEVESILAGLGI